MAWTPDGKGSYAFEDGTFKRTDILTGEKTPLFDDAKLLAAVNAMTGRQEVKIFFNRFQYLDEGKKIQFQAFNKVFIYDLASSKLVSSSPQRSITGVRGRSYGDTLSPTSISGFHPRLQSLYQGHGRRRDGPDDGRRKPPQRLPRWVYPEELGQYEAFWWSPDSKKIAFMQFDESPVARVSDRA